MKDKVEARFYYLLRWFRDGKLDVYARNANYGARNSWYTTNIRSESYRFPNRAEAKQRIKLKAFKDLLNGPRRSINDRFVVCEIERYFWEIIKVTETIVTSYADEIVGSDKETPAMVVLARSAR